MKKRTKLVFFLLGVIFFTGSLVFTNDWVRDHTSAKIAPVMITALFILTVMTLMFTKTKPKD